ncbi:MAG: nucleoside kinase [Firmicutes bacterium]|nr:nucleoside kinase [Bacillota bacterium]
MIKLLENKGVDIMKNIRVTVGNETKNYPAGLTYYEISREFDRNRRNKILAAKINNELFSLDMKCDEDCNINFVDVTDENGYKMYQAALKFIFILAIRDIFPGSKVIFEHSVPKGILATVEDVLIENVDIPKVKGKMASIIAEDIKFEKLNIYKKEAIKYYKLQGEKEKAKNIYNKSFDIVNIYRLKDELNYFYTEMPYSTGAIDKFDIRYVGDNRFVLILPSKRTEGRVPEYVHYQNIIDSFYEGKEWLKKVNVPYLSNLNGLIAKSDIGQFISACELTFNNRVGYAASEIAKNKNIKVVLIAGPSSSGKTTTTKRLTTYLNILGVKAVCISADDYFVDKVKTPKDENGNYDFECLRAIKLEELNEDLDKLISGEEITLPVYDFALGTSARTGKKIKLEENGIILIEGLHSLNDEMTPKIDKSMKYKIYLSPFIPLNIDPHNYISTVDLRLIRRIIRDFRTRGRSVSESIESWQSVREGEEKYIFPYIPQADTIINTALPYELNVLKVFVEPLLYSVTYDSKYYEETRRLIEFLKRFYSVSSEYVASSSILREFIGWKGDFYD